MSAPIPVVPMSNARKPLGGFSYARKYCLGNAHGKSQLTVAAKDAKDAPGTGMRWGYPRAAITISLGNFLCDAACALWWPFIPLYLMDVGAPTAAEAVYWLAVASIVQGIGRLVAGPLWGVLSDRYGRKMMYLRAVIGLFFTTIMFAFIAEPWQVVIVLGLHGIFSGYDGPAVAMLSVSVPDSQFKKSLGLFTALRYLGQSVGPAIGAVLTIAFGYRDTILVSAVLTGAVLVWVARAAPADRIVLTSDGRPKSRPRLEPFRPTNQLWLAVFIFGILVTLAQVLRITTPIALRFIEGQDVPGVTGIAFTLGGLAAAAGVFVLSSRYFRIGRLRPALIACSLIIGVAFLLLGFIDSVTPYIVMFAIISLLQAAMMPTSNMLIAFNTSSARRGTAFGLGGSAQAISIAIGPIAAAVFVATSMRAGFAMVGLMCAALALLVHLQLREPRPDQHGA